MTAPAPEWLARVREAAPDLGTAFAEKLALVLANPRMQPDGLLVVADALEEVLRVSAELDPLRRVEIRLLADLFRAEAPRRARI